ncbi:hypothetical protein C5167_026645 [Papaver somniferum]|nr:hypothetical protein C5167_026645 [Papaver somniferum]
MANPNRNQHQFQSNICGWLLENHHQHPGGLAGNPSDCTRSQLRMLGIHSLLLTSLSFCSYNPFVLICNLTVISRVRGSTMIIALWGSAVNQVGNDPIDCDSIPCPVLVAVCSTFVKNYQGKITLSSTNAAKVYNNVDIPEIIEMRASPICQAMLTYAEKMLGDVKTKSETRHTNESNAAVQENELDWSESRKTIAELFEIVWENHSYNISVEDPTETTIFEAPDLELQKILRCTEMELLHLEESQTLARRRCREREALQNHMTSLGKIRR